MTATFTFTDDQREFIKRALKVTSFNLREKDFHDSSNQEAIRYLYYQNLFEDLPDLYVNGVDKNALNASIKKLKRSRYFSDLYTYKPGDVGPGEVMLYLLVTGAGLAGQRSSGDLSVGGTTYEIKGCKINRQDQMYVDFDLGGTVNTDDLSTEIKRLAVENGIITNPNESEFPKSNMQALRAAVPERMEKIENTYRQRAGVYFSKHEAILMSTSLADRGEIYEVGTIVPQRIGIERVTRKTLKTTIRM